MTGKSGNIKTYTAEQLEKMAARGEDRTDWDMSHEEAMRRRAADPDAPQPYPEWAETITVQLPEPKRHLNLRIDADVVEWFRKQGRGYQTRMSAVLRAYMRAHRS